MKKKECKIYCIILKHKLTLDETIYFRRWLAETQIIF